jgi:hypothetical protein
MARSPRLARSAPSRKHQIEDEIATQSSSQKRPARRVSTAGKHSTKRPKAKATREKARSRDYDDLPTDLRDGLPLVKSSLLTVDLIELDRHLDRGSTTASSEDNGNSRSVSPAALMVNSSPPPSPTPAPAPLPAIQLCMQWNIRGRVVQGNKTRAFALEDMSEGTFIWKLGEMCKPKLGGRRAYDTAIEFSWAWIPQTKADAKNYLVSYSTIEDEADYETIRHKIRTSKNPDSMVLKILAKIPEEEEGEGNGNGDEPGASQVASGRQVFKFLIHSNL